MQQLTFRGFLKDYVRQLSAANTTRLSTLVRESAETNPRLREPLLLYAVFDQKTDALTAFLPQTGLGEYYGSLLRLNEAAFRQFLENGNAPEEYQKVWNSYLVHRAKIKNDNHTKELIRTRVLSLQSEKNISNYRIYTELRLNPGNINRWLKSGDSRVISLAVANRILEFTESFPEKSVQEA